MDHRFAWQAWHLATSTSTLRGRCGTYGTGLALVAHKTLPHNFVTDSFHTQLCHRFISHTTLSHKPFTHNFVTHNPFTHNFVTHNSFTHNSFTHNFVTYISFTHKLLHTTLLQHKLTHTQHCLTQLFHPTCLAPSPFLPAFPIAFSHLIGDHWKKLICGVIRSFSFFSCKIIADADATGTVRASRSVILCTTAFF